MIRIQYPRFFSLFMSLALLVSPLPLSAMAQDLVSHVSDVEAALIKQNLQRSYIYLGKDLSNISHVLSEISSLDNDNNSPLYRLQKDIDNGCVIAEYEEVASALYYAEDVLHKYYTELDYEKAEQIGKDFESITKKFINGSLTIGAHHINDDLKRSFVNIVQVLGLLSVNDQLVQNITAVDFSATDAIIQNATITTLSTTDQIIDNIDVIDISAVDATVTGTLSASDIVVDNELRFTDTAGGEYVGIQAPSLVTSNYTVSLPSTAPTANQVLRANVTTPTNLEWFSEGGSVPPAISKTIYVTKYGNDVTGDGSFDSPYASLSQAITIANSIASVINPIAIVISAGIYTENNSVSPLTITADGISIVGDSASSVIIMPNTPANDLLLVNNTIRISNITFQSSSPLATGISLASGNLSVLSNVRVVNFLIGVDCSGGATQTYGFIACLLINNGTALNVNNTRVEWNNSTVFGTSVIAGPAANTGINISGSASSVVFNGGVMGLCATGINITSNAFVTVSSISFRINAFDIIQDGASRSIITGCTFELTDSAADIDMQISGAGTIAEIISCEFNGASPLGVPQGTGIAVSDDGVINISGGVIHNYTTGMEVGTSLDTSSTMMAASGVTIRTCTTDILQQGSTTLLFEGSTASSSKISINDATNVELAFFDLEDNGALTIGSTADQDTTLLQVDIDSSNHPGFNYKSSLYSTQAIGFENSFGSASSLYSLSADNAQLTAITTDRTNIAGLRLVSDTGSPVGGTSALRGWDINKNASAAELSFTYQNSDIVGQSAVSPYVVMQLDGVSNQLQLPTASTQIIFASDTNLYRSAANVLRTDDNFIVGTLTPDRVVITNSVTNQLASSAVTSTELGYLSGVASSIQTQLNGKVAKAGDTMTGALQLPAGTTALPSLVFTGSTTSGLSASSGDLSLSTDALERLKIANDGTISVNAFNTAGIVHNDSSGNLSSSLIVNADVAAGAAIVDTKLATISTAGKVANSATTATSSNTASAIVARDVSGNFSAGIITANLSGNATTATTATNFSGSLSGDVTGTQGATVVSLVDGQTATNVAAATILANAATSANTASAIVRRSATGGFSAGAVSITDGIVSNTLTITPFNTAGVVHNDSSGLLSSSLIVNADITNSTISNAKLATISSTNTAGNIVVRDGSGNFATNMITIAGTVTNPTDTATKAYVDSAVSTGLVAKDPAVVVSIANETLSGLPTIDGVTLIANDRVLLTGQTDPIENGLWVVAAGAWSRPADFNTGDTAGQAYVLILSGTIYGGSSWLCNTPTAVIDTDPIGFALFSLPNTTTGANVGSGTGLIFRDKTGNDINFKSLIQGSHIVITNNTDDITIATDATNTNTASTVVARDASGNFSAGTITANLSGNATTATTATNFSGALSGDVTGTQGATVVSLVGGQSAANVAAATILANAATSANTASAIVRRSAAGGFSAGEISVTDAVISNAVTITPFTADGIVHNDSSGLLSSSLIVNADVDAAAAIVDTKLATISTAGKVDNSATTATSANTANAIVARDASGNFSASLITASLTGAASLNVLKAGDTMTGALQLPAGTAAAPSLRFTGSTTTGLSAATANTLSFDTNGVERLNIGSTGGVTINAFGTAGIVHNDSSGLLSSSLIVNADVSASAGIVDTKLATISTAGKVANSATTATSANTVNAIVARDASGNFNAGTIVASLTGAASLNVLKAGDTMTGALQLPAGTTAAPALVFTGSTTTGLSASAGALSFSTSTAERMRIASGGTISVNAFTSAGVVHNDASGNLSSSLIVNADVAAGAAIADTKLATISTAGKVSNSATTATSANTASAIVARDASGNFNANMITLAGTTTNATDVATKSYVDGQISATGTNLNTANALVRRDSTGSFAAQVVSVVDTVASGNLVLSTNPSTSTAGNIMKGVNSFIHNFGTNNTFVGINSGNFTLTGNSNTAFGVNALTAVTTGTSNTAIGINALSSNTTGSLNTGVGAQALGANGTGANNTAIGVNALAANTTASNNTAVGSGALAANTTGVQNTAVGHNALAVNTIGIEVTAVGQGALGANTTGGQNTAVGRLALSANTIGIANTAVGRLALQNNTTGVSNTAVGFNSLLANTIGTNNTAVGASALTANTTGVSNTAVGSNSLAANTTGINNTAMGTNALDDNTIGTGNTAVGQNALTANTTGINNTAVGVSSLAANTTGTLNTAFGSNALAVHTGSSTTAFGSSALAANTTGVNNTAIGANALATNTIGVANTAVGLNALNVNTTGNTNTALGANALAANTIGSANTAIGGSALSTNTTGGGNTAIGTNTLAANTTGQDNIAVGGNTLLANTSGNSNTAIGKGTLVSNTIGGSNTGVGAGALNDNTAGNSNIGVGVNSLQHNTTGGSNIGIGSFALANNTTGSSNIAIGNSALVNTSGSNNIGVGNLTFNNLTSGSNNVAIGVSAGGTVTTGSGNLYINAGAAVATEANTTRIGSSQTRTFISGISGVTTAGAAVAVLVDASGQLGTISSSRTLKHNIQAMADESAHIYQLKPVTFAYNSDESERKQYGLIAEEVDEIFPSIVVKDEDGQPVTVQYHVLPVLLLNELIKQNNVITELQQGYRSLIQMVESANQRIAQLEYSV